MKKKEKNNEVNVELVNDNNDKKTKRGSKIVETFNIYKFMIKVVATALLITFGVIMLVKQDSAVFALFLISGGVLVLSAVIRLFSLLKKDKSAPAKKILAGVCLIHLVIGVYLIIAGVIFNKDVAEVNNEVDNLEGFSKFNVNYFALFIAIALYVQAVGFFWQTVLHKVNAGKVMFWIHIAYMTLSLVLAFLATNNNVTAKHIVIFIAVVALLCALLIGGEAGVGYFRYRNEMNKINGVKKEKKDKKEEGLDAPSEEDLEKDKLIIDEPDAKDQDSIVV